MSVKKESKKENNINVSNINYESSTTFGSNSLSFIITGNNVNNIFSHTINRAIISLVGSFAFNSNNIYITKNTSIFHNDYLKLRISNTPILFKNYDYETIENFSEMCVELEEKLDKFKEKEMTEFERIEYIKKNAIILENNIQMFVSAINNTTEIMYVTSNEKYTTFYKNGIVIPDIYPMEINIVALKPGQEIIFSAISDFNIPSLNGIYSSAYRVRHKMINNNSYQIILHSYRQINEKQIVKFACEIIILKLKKLKTNILLQIQKLIDNEKNEEKDYNYKGLLKIENENHTMGEIFNRRLQDNEFSKYGAFKMDHPDEKIITIEYEVEGMNIFDVVENCIKTLCEDYLIVKNNIK